MGLKYLIYRVDSNEYKLKLEIVRKFEERGIDYRNTKIHIGALNAIKAYYGDDWEENARKY